MFLSIYTYIPDIFTLGLIQCPMKLMERFLLTSINIHASKTQLLDSLLKANIRSNMAKAYSLKNSNTNHWNFLYYLLSCKGDFSKYIWIYTPYICLVMISLTPVIRLYNSIFSKQKATIVGENWSSQRGETYESSQAECELFSLLQKSDTIHWVSLNLANFSNKSTTILMSTGCGSCFYVLMKLLFSQRSCNNLQQVKNYLTFQSQELFNSLGSTVKGEWLW